MKANFSTALDHVLVHEGGWADHPADPGGATMKGVTLMTYRRFFGSHKGKSDLRRISHQELEEIYRTGYWDKCRCDDLPSGVDYAVFDAAVNSGPGRAARWLQFVLGAHQDGSIGPVTLSLVDSQTPTEIVNRLCDRRLAFMKSLRTWSVFGKGWGRRVAGVRATALELATERSDSAETAPVDFEIVRKGSTGEWVKKLQQALDITADGIFGSMTEAALKAWQETAGLEPDGIAGPKTYKALGLIP